MNELSLEAITEAFGLKDVKPREVAPLILAYIGDAVYEVVVRTITLSRGNRSINIINKDSVRFVKAGTQALLSDLLQEDFTEEEAVQFRRGKNAKPANCAKNATLTDYHKATGFEAVMGYLYLNGQNDRIVELCKLGFEKAELIK